MLLSCQHRWIKNVKCNFPELFLAQYALWYNIIHILIPFRFGFVLISYLLKVENIYKYIFLLFVEIIFRCQSAASKKIIYQFHPFILCSKAKQNFQGWFLSSYFFENLLHKANFLSSASRQGSATHSTIERCCVTIKILEAVTRRRSRKHVLFV